MVSRRKILSHSRDDLNLPSPFHQQMDEEDVWYQKEKLFKEHIQEVLNKWKQIDDEIWGKVIIFERNRRVAKAYARAPVLTINGSEDGFDGIKIGLCGFDNPMRDPQTEELRRHVGYGVQIKMDAGNILIRRYSRSNVFIKSTTTTTSDDTAIGADILKSPKNCLEREKSLKLFDMKKFRANINRELKSAYPDRRRLETQCLSVVSFVRAENEILECPIWVLLINVVAIDMLRQRLPPIQHPLDVRIRPRIPVPDENPYSIAENICSRCGNSGNSGNLGNLGNSSNSRFITTSANETGHAAPNREQLSKLQKPSPKRSEKTPKLPPRDNIYPHDIPEPDYDEINDDGKLKPPRVKSDKGKYSNKIYDDPYYCGLRARVPNFTKASKYNRHHK